MSSTQILRAAATLSEAVDGLQFSAPVTHTYNPLAYAWAPHSAYLRRYGASKRRILFLGMNPGPFGMVQTGVPFGEIESVRGWLGIVEPVRVPAKTHPQRPILGFDCPRCEVSGKRLWGLFASRFRSPAEFFKEHFVANYCPLAFLEEGGRNRTPDKLPGKEREALYEVCDTHLRAVVAALKPEWVVGIGDFAANRAREALLPGGPQVVRILHPSPASPAANKDWAGTVTRQLRDAGIW